MIVQKFGGTSVADGERLIAAAGIVRDHLAHRPIVVVSALAGVTDLLDRAVGFASSGRREELEPVLAEIERRHRWALPHVAPEPGHRHDLALALDAGFEELRQLLRSLRVLGEATPRARDAVLAFGERWSSRLLNAALATAGVDATWVDPRSVIVTDRRFGNATADAERTAKVSRDGLCPHVDRGAVPVVGGFTGATPDGSTTTLGRGGGDTTAAVLGAALGAREIQVWTDVDGLMTADPRLVPEAETLDRVSFAEAAELAFYGAKVLHPASIEPAVRRQIPVRVRNTNRPERPGTVIVDADDVPPRITSVASRSGVRLVRVVSPSMNVDPTFLAAVAECCARRDIAPDLMVSSEIGAALALRDDDAGDAVEHDLASVGRVSSEAGRAVICVVGAGLGREPQLRGRVLEALGALGAEVVSLGGSGTSVAALVDGARLSEGVRRLHGRFFVREGSA